MIENRNIVWAKSSVTQKARNSIVRQRPMVLWFTGLSGSGKSTIAAAAEKKLTELGYLVFLLDGDNVRHGLCSDLGFSEVDRTENLRRIAETAKLIADSGAVVLCSTISPLAIQRETARKIIASDHPFAEVYVSADLKICAERDVKGFYKKALSGEIKNFTGISAPYEVPEAPELMLDSECKTIDECRDEVVDFIISHQEYSNTLFHGLKKEISTLPLYRDVLDVIVPAAKEAGAEIMKIYRTDFLVEYKDDKSPLTEADIASNKVICKRIRSAFPDIPILSEEKESENEDMVEKATKRLNSRFCFIIDPLDGTKEFVKKNDEFTVNIALSDNGISVCGAIYVPATDTMYFAARGCGAWKQEGMASAVRISSSDRSDAMILMLSRSHTDERTEKLLAKYSDRIAGVERSGSSIKGCFVAEGKADAYYRFGYTMEWDTAAMQCICEEAGATVMQCDGTPLVYNRVNNLNDKGFYIVNRRENTFELTE